MNKIIGIVARRAVSQNTRLLCCGHYQLKFYSHIGHDEMKKNTCIQSNPNSFLIKRFKHNKKASVKRAQQNEELDEDEEDEEDEESEYDESKSKTIILTAKVHSLRVDVVAKSGLSVSRKKIEEAFYESKIRVNGKKVFKLSTEVGIDDEIDLIRDRSSENPNFLIVSRVTVLSVDPVADGIKLKLSKDKNLLIEEYPEPWNN